MLKKSKTKTKRPKIKTLEALTRKEHNDKHQFTKEELEGAMVSVMEYDYPDNVDRAFEWLLFRGVIRIEFLRKLVKEEYLKTKSKK